MLQNKQKFVAWRLRLTSSIKEASHDELERADNWLEKFATVCGAMVFFGVVLEVFIAVENPPYGNDLERWGSSVADTFVALGVLGEVLASSRGKKIQGELTRRSNLELTRTRLLARFADTGAKDANDAAARALRELASAKRDLAEASERLTNAELKAAELERLTGWRSISFEARGRLADVIKSLRVPIRLGIGVVPHNPEATSFQYEIASCFLRAEQEMTGSGVGGFSAALAQPPFSQPFGVYLCTTEEVDEFKIAAAFSAEGVHIQCSLLDFSSIFTERDGGPNVCFFVAAKPSPANGFPEYEQPVDGRIARRRPHSRIGRDGKLERLPPSS